MKRMLIGVIAIALTACASTDKSASTSTTTARAASGTYFCWRDRLTTAGDNLMCNWEADARTACSSSGSTPLSKSAIAKGPDPISRCENGQWLVQVTMK